MKKNMNQNPIIDALNGLDEEPVCTCMSEDITSHRTTSPRGAYRKLAVAAACLMLTLGLGAAVALPLMRAEPPALPTDTTAPLPAVSTSPLLWNDEPSFVNIQLLSFDTVESEDTPPSDSTVNVETNNIFRNKHLLLQFDCTDGETVVITSHDPITRFAKEISEVLAEMERLKNQEEQDFLIDIDARRALHHRILKLESEIRSVQYGNDTIVIGDSDIESMLAVNDTTYLWGLARSMTDYETIDFFIHNENGEITGAGSICIGIRSHTYVDQLRYEVLGSRRYERPVDEDEARAYIASLRDIADEAYAVMDFTPQNSDEGFKIARSAVHALLPADSASEEWDTSGYSDSQCDFHWYTFRKIDTPKSPRRFILLPDGNYAEVASESGKAFDAMITVAFYGPHDIEADYSDTRLTLTDGRIMTFIEETYMDPDKQIERSKWVTQISECNE